MQITAAVAAACLPALAAAQAVPSDKTDRTAEPSKGLETIVVTAQKIAQSAQSVPLAITAISAADLDNRQAFTLNDLKYMVPGLEVEQNFSNLSTPEIFMRGNGQANSSFSFDSPIGIYVDDVYYAKETGSMVDFMDIDHIEVLRGPQGTIYGRNSSVGAIRVVTKSAPLHTADFKGDISFGDYDQRNGRFTVGLPLIDGTMGLRVSGDSKYNSGFETNTVSGERVFSQKSNAVRAELLTKFSDNLSLTIRGDFLRDDGLPSIGIDYLTGKLSSLQFQSELSYGLGTARSRIETFGASATVNAKLDDIKLTSITAWRGINTLSTFDADGTTESSFEVPHNDLIDRWITQEVFATGERFAGLPVTWVAGVFLLHEQTENLNGLTIFAPPSLQSFNQLVNSEAGYAQGTWHLTDKLGLTGGARYTAEHKNFGASSHNPDGSLNFSYFNNDLNTDRWTWRGAVNYQIEAPVLLYGSVATGFRSGGLNGQATDLADITGGAVQAEDSLMYEVGEKSQWLNNHLRLNVDYYLGSYTHLQDNVVRQDGEITTTNNTAHVRGVEIEASWIPLNGVELSANLATLHDTIEDSSSVLADAPHLTWNLAASYSHGLGALGAITLGAAYSYTGNYYQDSENTPIIWAPSHDIIDAHATLATLDDHWEFTLAGFNLTNKIYSTGGFYIFNGIIAATEWPSMPRRWTLSVQYKY